MITLKELSFSYSRKKEVLDRINLEVGSGHICGLLGKKRTDLSVSRFLPRIGGNSFRAKRSFLAADLLIAGGNLHAGGHRHRIYKDVRTFLSDI